MSWRRPFLVVVSLGLLVGCDKKGTGSDQGGGPIDDCEAQLIQRITNDHGHALVEPMDPDETLFRVELAGNAGHSHFIELNALFIDAVIEGTAVTVETSTNSLHTHQVTLGFTLPPGCGGFDDGFDDGFEDGVPPGVDEDGPGIPPSFTSGPGEDFTSGPDDDTGAGTAG